jgi:tight adherence protein B
MHNILEVLGRLAPLKYGAIGLLAFGLLIGTFAIVRDTSGVVYRLWARYCAHVEHELHRQFIFRPGRHVAFGQLAGLFVVLLLGIFMGADPVWTLGFLIAVVAVPLFAIERMRRKRVHKIELQLDGFLLALANALKATPSLGNAFISVQSLMTAPLKEELELASKEMRVGSTLDQALLLMAARIGSRQVDSALSALLIGRQAGGNLPRILDTTSETLREMSRLDAMVQAKTAEGKAQMGLLSVFPILLIMAFTAVKPDYFDPLTASVSGFAIMAVAAMFWIASIVVARKIVSVDI